MFVRVARIAVLAAGEQESDDHIVKFDGTELASGVYLYRMQAGAFTETKKLSLVQ